MEEGDLKASPLRLRARRASQKRRRGFCLKRSLTTTTRTVSTSQLDPLSFFQRAWRCCR